MRCFLRILADDSGQDVVEYALLAAVIGIAAIVVWHTVAERVGNAYGAADTNVQGLATPPDPIGG